MRPAPSPSAVKDAVAASIRISGVAETDGGSTKVIWLGEAPVTPDILMLPTPAEREPERSVDFVTPPSIGSDND
jgi:hypothetical protein